MHYYFLGAVKNYYLSKASNKKNRNTMKVLFENLFHIVSFDNVYDINNQLVIKEDALAKINDIFICYVSQESSWVKIYPIPEYSLKYMKELDYFDNDYIIEVYTKNFVKPSLNSLKESIKKKMDMFKRHTLNLKKIKNANRIVSFDFEYASNCKLGISEIGITTYNPKKDEKNCHHFLIDNNTAQSKRRKNLGKEFRFGVSKTATLNEALLFLNKLIKNADFIIGHDLINEFNILNINPEWQKVVDTKYCDIVLNNREQYFSLENILRFYGFKTAFLHNAGNDAAYTLDVIMCMMNQIKTK